MKITMWGTRGSVPVVGSRFLRYGGATTCLAIELEGAGHDTPPRIIIDCGTGLAELGRRQGIDGALMLQTHLHWDHIQGFPFFGPLFDPRARFEFWCVARDGRSFREILDDQMRRPFFPVGLEAIPSDLDFREIDPVGERWLGELRIAWTELCHPSGSTAYRLDFKGRSFVFSGDVEVALGCRERLISFARGADVLVMDAQYFPEEYATREGWGHSTPVDAVEVAKEAGVTRLILTHHDPSHDDARLDAKLALARQHATGGLQVDNAFDGMSVTLAERLDSMVHE